MENKNNTLKQVGKEKAKWTVLLFIAIFLFVISLMTGIYYLSLISIFITIYIYKNGRDKILFKEYNEKRKSYKNPN